MNKWIAISKYILFTSIIGYSFFSCSNPKRISQPNELLKIYPIGKNGLWGYADKNGEVVIDYQFEAVNFFCAGLAGAKKEGKYGFINRLGAYEIKPQFDSVDIFTPNTARVYKNNKSYRIDRKGKKTKQDYFGSGSCGAPSNFSDPMDYFKKTGNQYELLESELKHLQRLDPAANLTNSDFTFDELIPFSSRSIIVRKGEKYGIYVHYNRVGLKELWVDEITPFYMSSLRGNFSYEARTAKVRIGDKWGLVSSMGHLVLEPEFYTIKRSSGIFYLVEYQPNYWGHMTLSNRYFKK